MRWEPYFHPKVSRRVEAQSVIYIPEVLLERTGELVASFAEVRPSEGIVYWFGLELASKAVVTSLVVPDARTTEGSVETSVESNAEAQGAIVGTSLVLLGQAHSHAGWNVKHSDVDDEKTFARFDGAVSLVIPYYGRYGVNLVECGLYRHIGGRFHEVAPENHVDHLIVLPGIRDYRKHQGAISGRVR